MRRLHTPLKPLYLLNKIARSPVDVIRNTSKYYIDNFGKIFFYEKGSFCPLKFHKILKTNKSESGKIVLKLQGINFPVTVPRPVPLGYSWAGMLYLNNEPWLLYSYSQNKEKTTIRKV